MWNPFDLAIVCATFALAGLVKGVAGLGLPTISLACLAATLGVREAMALIVLPALATNLWQALAGRTLRSVLARIWPLLLAALPGIWIAGSFAARADTALLAHLLGIALCAYAALGLAAPRLPAPGRWERWLSPAIGASNGIVTGLTGTFAVPGVPYLQALQLPRDSLVQAMGLLFTVSTLGLGATLLRHALLSRDAALVSVGALLPALLGMALGQRVRGALPEPVFRRVFFLALLALGTYMALRPAL